MSLTVNGRLIETIEGESLECFLEKQKLLYSRIAIELNEQIVIRSLYKETILKNGDVIEIIGVVGGG
jgi:sulfur carrier protein